MGQVTFLVEGARAVITHHQLVFVFPSTDATLVIVLLILLPGQTHDSKSGDTTPRGPFNIGETSAPVDSTLPMQNVRSNGLTSSVPSGLHRLHLHSSESIVKSFT